MVLLGAALHHPPCAGLARSRAWIRCCGPALRGIHQSCGFAQTEEKGHHTPLLTLRVVGPEGVAYPLRSGSRWVYKLENLGVDLPDMRRQPRGIIRRRGQPESLTGLCVVALRIQEVEEFEGLEGSRCQRRRNTGPLENLQGYRKRKPAMAVLVQEIEDGRRRGVRHGFLVGHGVTLLQCNAGVNGILWT